MKSTILKPYLLALLLLLPAVSSHAGDDVGEQATKTAPPTMEYYNPWLDFIHMQAAMDREFNAMAMPLWMPVAYFPQTAMMAPAVQDGTLKRTDGGYQAEFKLPGYKPEDIHVRLDGRQLTVSAESSSQSTTKVGEQSEQSQSSRSFAETMTLPGAIQASGLKESYKDGVLTVVVPGGKDAAGSA